MSSGVDDRATPGRADKADLNSLRAMAHPARMQILSLLTGTAMSAAEVARELGLTHANASYHLRLLHNAGLLVDAGEESIRGGKAKRYRYDLTHPGSSSPDAKVNALYYEAVAAELVRRAAARTRTGVEVRGTSSDAELWVTPEVWTEAVELVSKAAHDLHVAARPPRTPGTVHVSLTTALFAMGSDRTPGPGDDASADS
jgi:DNA-binding transcriptional ArsR family regulator